MMIHRKHELPFGIMEDDEVCIGWVAFEAWHHLGWRTKRFCFATFLPFPIGGYDNGFCAATVVGRSEMLKRGYTETQYGFVKHFAWENY